MMHEPLQHAHTPARVAATVELLLVSSVQPLPASLKLAVPVRLPSSPVAPLLMLRLVDMRLQLAYSTHDQHAN